MLNITVKALRSSANQLRVGEWGVRRAHKRVLRFLAFLNQLCGDQSLPFPARLRGGHDILFDQEPCFAGSTSVACQTVPTQAEPGS
jgi:hypothetical protein